MSTDSEPKTANFDDILAKMWHNRPQALSDQILEVKLTTALAPTTLRLWNYFIWWEQDGDTITWCTTFCVAGHPIYRYTDLGEFRKKLIRLVTAQAWKARRDQVENDLARQIERMEMPTAGHSVVVGSWIVGRDDENDCFTLSCPGFSFVGVHRTITLQPTVAHTAADLEGLKLQLWFATLEGHTRQLHGAMATPVDERLTELAAAIPYPQGCLCQDAARGLMANDCHVHNIRPPHYFDADIETDCTCP